MDRQQGMKKSWKITLEWYLRNEKFQILKTFLFLPYCWWNHKIERILFSSSLSQTQNATATYYMNTNNNSHNSILGKNEKNADSEGNIIYFLLFYFSEYFPAPVLASFARTRKRNHSKSSHYLWCVWIGAWISLSAASASFAGPAAGLDKRKITKKPVSYFELHFWQIASGK